jgi:phage baseplate assembly protein W
VRLLAHPFRLAGNGTVATVEQGSDEANAQQIAALLLTETGERPLAPGFGITDPTFRGIDATEVIAAVAEHGPDVTVGDVTVRWESESTQLVDVTFE